MTSIGISPILFALSKGRLATFGQCIFAATLVSSVCAQGVSNQDSGVVGREMARRTDKAINAKDIILQGDENYRKGDYAQALKFYEQALGATPVGAITAEFRQGIIQRIGIASQVRAQELGKIGDYDAARKLLERVLTIDPSNEVAKTLLAQYQDSVRYNPANSPGHVSNVQKVNALLHKARGHVELGEFDKAQESFEAVLRIDKYNVAARRGMEKVQNLKMEYYSAANDQTRAKMLMEVMAAWETPVPPANAFNSAGGNSEDLFVLNKANESVKMRKHLEELMIPKVNLDNVTLPEAIDYLRAMVRSLPSSNGINIVLLNSPALQDKKVSLNMTNVPASEVLNQFAAQTGVYVNYTPYAIQLSSEKDQSSAMVTRVFPLTPDFFSQQKEETATAAAADPFAESGAQAESGIKVSRRNPVEVFRKMGVEFKPGTYARYNPSLAQLTVCNTLSNVNAIEEIVESHMNSSLDQVLITCTLIEASEKTLKELGFDWAIGFQHDASSFISGGAVSPTKIFPDNVVPTATYQSSLTTSGLRSGKQALPQNNLDARIASAYGNDPFSMGTYDTPAPGIITVRAVLGQTQIIGMMRGLDQKKGIDKLQRPAMIAKSGQKASLSNIKEFLYPEAYDPPQIPDSFGVNDNNDDFNNNNNNNNNNGPNGMSPVAPAHPNSFAMKEIGTLFEVEPTISEDKRTVELTISPQFSELDGFVNYGSPINFPMVVGDDIFNFPVTRNLILQPVFSTKKLNQTITVYDDSTVVMGGLLSSRVRKYEDKVPILGSIPFLGKLFTSSGKEIERKAIIILCHVKVVDPTGRSIKSLPQNPQPEASVSPVLP